MIRKVKKRELLVLGILLLCLAGLAYSYWPGGSNRTSQVNEAPKTIKQFVYGFDLDSFDIDRFELEPNDFLGEILAARGIEYDVIDRLARVAELPAFVLE